MAAVLVVAVVTAAVAMMLTRSLAAKIPKHLLISWNQISAAETFAMLMAVALLSGVIPNGKMGAGVAATKANRVAGEKEGIVFIQQKYRRGCELLQ